MRPRGDPAADQPRLVFADWLEENGAEEYAEFVRVQIALEAMKPDGIENCRAEWTKLCAREATLWELINDGLLDQVKFIVPSNAPPIGNSRTVGIIDCGLGSVVFTFARGPFLKSVRCTAADWLAHGQAILRQQPVETILLDGAIQVDIDLHDVGRWTLYCSAGPHCAAYRTRAALIDAMPAQLRAWSVGEPRWLHGVVANAVREALPNISVEVRFP